MNTRIGRRRLGAVVASVAAGLVLATGSADARQATDTTPPTISGPTSYTAAATADCGETFCANVPFSFTLTDPDDAPDQITVSRNTNNGTLFFWGMSIVTCQAQDPAGNHSAPFSITVNVTVPPPTFQNTPAPITTSATGPFGAVVTFVPPTATDVGGRAAPVSCDQQSGITYPVGTTTVTCTAAIKRNDSNGTPIGGLPTATTQFTITVTTGGGGGGGGGTGGGGGGGTTSSDTTAPAITQNANVKVNATSARGAAVTYAVTAPDPDNGSATVAISCTPASGSTFALGSHAATRATTVTCHAHDPAGNQATPMSFVVTVLGGHDQLVALEARLHAANTLSKLRKASLRSKLTRADLDFRTGAKSKANVLLGFFITQVGKLPAPLTRAQKSAWITAAARIIAVLG